MNRTTIIDIRSISVSVRRFQSVQTAFGEQSDKYGKLAVPFRYQDAWSSHGGPLLVKRNDLWGFVDARGDEVISPAYEFCYGFSSGVAVVKDNGT